MIVLGIGFVLGIILGSLVLCIASRSLTGESFWGRSYCEKCKHKLAWYDLLPVVSYLVLKGKCRYCKKKISPEYLIVEICMGILIGFLFFSILNDPLNTLITHSDPVRFLLFNGGSLRILEFVFKAFVVSVLVAVFITDYKTGLIPDRISFPAIKTALVYLLALTAYKIFLIYYSLQNSTIGKYLLPPHSDYFFRHSLIATETFTSGVLAAILVGLFFATLIFVTRGRGMGGGDLKLGVFMGLVLGISNVVLALMLAFFMGSIVGLGLLLTKRKRFGQTIPFGPFLTLGSIIALLWGEEIIRWYMRFNV